MQLDHMERSPDLRVPQITKKTDGYLFTRSDSTSRYLKWYESILYWTFGAHPREFFVEKKKYWAQRYLKRTLCGERVNSVPIDHGEETVPRSGASGTTVNEVTRMRSFQERFDAFSTKYPNTTFVLVFGVLGGLAMGIGSCIGLLIIFGLQHAYRFAVG